MLTPEVAERLARLEEKASSMETKIETIIEGQAKLSRDMQQYKGFIGGVVFIVSALWGIFVLAIDKVFPAPGAHP